MPTQLKTAAVAQRRDPETFRARAITASLAVKDLEKSLTWYRDKIGFYVEEKIQRSGKLAAVALKAGDVRILISQDDGGTGWDRVKGAGFTALPEFLGVDLNTDGTPRTATYRLTPPGGRKSRFALDTYRKLSLDLGRRARQRGVRTRALNKGGCW